MPVVAEPPNAFVAVNVTLYGWARLSLVVGVHVSVPDVLRGPGVNTALFPAGSAETSAVSDVIASPSWSAAVTFTVTCWPCGPETEAGAVTTGARSTCAIVIAEPADPESALDALNVTL